MVGLELGGPQRDEPPNTGPTPGPSRSASAGTNCYECYDPFALNCTQGEILWSNTHMKWDSSWGCNTILG